MLLRECDAGGVTRWQPCRVAAVRHGAAGFELDTDARPGASAARWSIATGGLSIPKIGASDFGYRLARQFGHRARRDRGPALVPLTFDARGLGAVRGAGGRCRCRCASRPARQGARAAFVEDLLFTHRGLSGPGGAADLELLAAGHSRCASTWRRARDLGAALRAGQARLAPPARQRTRRAAAAPPGRRLAGSRRPAWRAADRRGCATATCAQLAERLQRWELVPDGSEGYRKAEVTAGGVDTRELELADDARAAASPGLYFIGEVVDVTGWLGGYNFQWAWASAAACARALARWRQLTGFAARLRCAATPRLLQGALAGRAYNRRLGATQTDHSMTTIRVKENEPFDVALRRFKRTIEKLGLLTDLRAREFYEKPTAERKRKKAAAVKRHFKRVRSMQLPKKLY